MTCTFGVDIVKKSHGKARYALFIIHGEQEIKKIVSKAKLFRLVRHYNPSIVSVDNLVELFSSKEKLIKFLKSIPPTTKLVQIAGKQSLPYLSKRYGLSIDIKDPMDEARASAYLATYGVGEEVSVFVDKTRITVSRNRSLGKGGFRQNKYRRKIHNSVRSVYKEIRGVLDERDMEYVEETKPGYGGMSKGMLFVNASKQDLPVNSFKTRDVQVKVEAMEKDKIEFIPLSRTTVHFIAGIDPGTTIAASIVDLNGNLLGVRSKKNWSWGEVVEYILSFGQPVIVATDKSNAPEFVSKLRASFNAVLYTPKEDLGTAKKRQLVSNYRFLNTHERDATACAIDAFNSYKNKLLNVEKRISPGMDSDAIKTAVIRGISLKEALSDKKVEKQKEKKPVQEQVSREEINRKEKVIKELEDENTILRNEISALREEVEKLRNKLTFFSTQEHQKIRKDTYVHNLESEVRKLKKELKQKDTSIEELNQQLQHLKRIKMLEFLGWTSIKVIKKFTKDEINKIERDLGINEGDIIYIADSSGGGKASAEHLSKKEVKAIITKSTDMSHLAMTIFEERNIPIIEPAELDIEVADDIAVINYPKFEETYHKKLADIEKKKVEEVEKIVLEYKKDRSANVR
ncbi:MAG: DUF460 domain-containing protein [Archaeoglobaceae archaeon]